MRSIEEVAVRLLGDRGTMWRVPVGARVVRRVAGKATWAFGLFRKLSLSAAQAAPLCLLLTLFVGFPFIAGELVLADTRSIPFSPPPDIFLQDRLSEDVKKHKKWYSAPIDIGAGQAGRAQTTRNFGPLTLHFRPPDCGLNYLTYAPLRSLSETSDLNDGRLEDEQSFDRFQLRVDKQPIHEASGVYNIREPESLEDLNLNTDIQRYFKLTLKEPQRFVRELRAGRTLRVRYRAPWHGRSVDESYGKFFLAGSNTAMQRAKGLCQEPSDGGYDSTIEDYFGKPEKSEDLSTNTERDQATNESLRNMVSCSVFFLMANQLIETTANVPAETETWSSAFDHMAVLTYLEANKRAGRKKVGMLMDAEIDHISAKAKGDKGFYMLIEQYMDPCMSLAETLR